MSFYLRRHSTTANNGSGDEYARLNEFMLNIGSITDEITREVWLGGLADLRAAKLRKALEMQRAAPGYREELNKLRRRFGLSPI